VDRYRIWGDSSIRWGNQRKETTFERVGHSMESKIILYHKKAALKTRMRNDKRIYRRRAILGKRTEGKKRLTGREKKK